MTPGSGLGRDAELHPAVLAITPPEKQAIVSAYLGIPGNIELVVDYHPSGTRTLKERELGRGMYRDLPRPLFANADAAAFYRAVAADVAARQAAGQRVTYRDTEADRR